MRFLSLVSGAFLLHGSAQAGPAVPAAAPPLPAAAAPSPGAQRFRGTLAEFDGPFLTLKLEGKKTVTLGMTAATRIVHNRALRLADLTPGAYVGVAALLGADGKLRAQGVRVYSESVRGQGEGEYPMDPANPARLLVNGALGAVAPGGIGGVLTVTFHGAAPNATGACTGRAAPGGCTGNADIQFARGVPIVAIEGGDTALLLPGATLTATVSADAGGTLVATTVTIERDAPAPKPVPTTP